ELAQRQIRAIGKFDEPDECFRAVFLAPGDQRRRRPVESEQQSAESIRPVLRESHAGRYRRGGIARLNIHREVIAMARRLRQAAARIQQDCWFGVHRDQPAPASAARGQEAVAAQQRSVADYEQGLIWVRHQVCEVNSRSATQDLQSGSYSKMPGKGESLEKEHRLEACATSEEFL